MISGQMGAVEGRHERDLPGQELKELLEGESTGPGDLLDEGRARADGGVFSGEKRRGKGPGTFGGGW